MGPTVQFRLLNLASRSIQRKAGRYRVCATIVDIEPEVCRSTVCRDTRVVSGVFHRYRSPALSITAAPQIGNRLVTGEGPG